MVDDLEKLGRLLEKRIEQFRKSRQDSRWSDEALSAELEKFTPLETRIFAVEAKSLSELRIKVRAMMWQHGCNSIDDIITDKGAVSILKDILTIEASSTTVRSRMIGSFDGKEVLT